MLIDSLFIYYFIVYLFIYQLTYSVFGKRLNAPFIILTNLVFGAGIIYCLSSSLGLEKNIFIFSVLIGNFIVTLQNFKFNDRLWSLINLQLQLGLLLISLPNILFSFAGLILIIFSFGRNFDRKKEFVLNSAVSVWMLVFCLMAASYSSDIGILSLKTIINDYLILTGFLYFFLVYGLCRSLYEVSSIETDDIEEGKKIKNIVWLWLGVFCNYFVLLFNELEIVEKNFGLISKSSGFALTILLIILFIKIENVRSIYKHISYTIITQVSVLVFLVISHTVIGLQWLVYTNLSLLIYLLLDFDKLGKRTSASQGKLKFLAQVILLLLVSGLPFTPWFDSNLILLKQLKAEGTPVLYLIGLVFFGVRYRQNLILLINFVRANKSKQSKAS